jgi:DNA-binding beta-propeller fold protein YncE
MATIFAIIASCSIIVSGTTEWIVRAEVGSFEHANRIAICPDGSILICDEGRNEITLFDGSLKRLASTGGYGWGNDVFEKPTGVAGDGLNYYVADYGNHRVLRLDRSLSYISSLRTRDTSVAEARFGYPQGIAVSSRNELFILDSENLRIVKFSSDGRFERSFGDNEPPEKKIVHPLDIAITQNNQVCVLDNSRILLFDFFGTFLKTIEEPSIEGATGFDAWEEGFVVTTSKLIIFLDNHGVAVEQYESSQILGASSVFAPFQDVARAGNNIYLITSSKCYRIEKK